jgi:hypothetical protein
MRIEITNLEIDSKLLVSEPNKMDVVVQELHKQFALAGSQGDLCLLGMRGSIHRYSIAFEAIPGVHQDEVFQWLKDQGFNRCNVEAHVVLG